MKIIALSLIIIAILSSCQKAEPIPQAEAGAPPDIAEAFAYPIGNGSFLTEAKDADAWYCARNFGEENHLGEDWNMNSGGNSDCGEPIFAAADGEIIYAADAGPGWGNVIIISHTLKDGSKLQTLYGHLSEMLKTSGAAKEREQIGKVGNANGKYLCHLHFELRTQSCPDWGKVGGGYSSERKGWLDPSEFLDKHRER